MSDTTLTSDEQYAAIIEQLRDLRFNKDGLMPYELESKLSKAVLKHVWSITVLKQATGMKNEAQVRGWFARNPDILERFNDSHRQLKDYISKMQTDMITFCNNEVANRKLLLDADDKVLTPENLDINSVMTVE